MVSGVLNLVLRELLLVLRGHHANRVVVDNRVEELLVDGVRVAVDNEDLLVVVGVVGVEHLVLVVVGLVEDNGVEELLVGGGGVGHVVEEQLLLGEVVVERKILRDQRRHSSLGGGKVDLKVSGRYLVLKGSIIILTRNSLNCLALLPLVNTGLGEPVPPEPGSAADLPGRDVLPPPGSSNFQLPPVTESQLGLPSFQGRLASLPGLEGDEGKLIVALFALVDLGKVHRTKLGEKDEDIST